ncbi:MAG: hypothetical protein Q4C41_00220 [Eggerthellaceae bacterium]|nr:hypothetical protein [Eggerthellaceae bacterium]
MRNVADTPLEERLRAHYRAERARYAQAASAATADEDKRALVALMTQETQASEAAQGANTIRDVNAARNVSTTASPIKGDTRITADSSTAAAPTLRTRRPSAIREALGFVAAQARFVRPSAWIAQLALIAVAIAACATGELSAPAVSFGAAAASAATVLIGLPTLTSSKSHGVSELEYACRFNCASVVAARLVVLGCTSVVVISCLCVAAPALTQVSTASFALHACAPYFLCTAGCLAATRRAAPHAALPLATAWVAVVVMVAYAAGGLVPHFYDIASVGAWAAVAAVSLAWAAREAYLLVSAAERGLDALCPAR